jgi:hypothetical protein
MATMRIEFRQQRNFGDKISATFDFLRANFLSIFRSIIFIAGPVILIGIGIFSILGSRIVDSWDTLFSNGFSSDVLVFITLIGGAVIYFVVIYVTIIAVVYSYIQLYLDESDYINDLQTVFEYTKANFMTVLSTSFGIIAVVLLVYGLIAGLLLGLIFGIGGSAGAASAGITVFLLFLVFIPLIIYTSVCLSFVFFIRVIEQAGFFESIRRSFSVVNGFWWETFGYVIVIGFIQGIFGYVFQIPMLVYAEFFPLVSLGQMEANGIYMVGYIITFLFYLFGSQILNVFNVTAISFQYFHLVETKEGVGLMQRINKVGDTKINKDDVEDF